MPLHSEPDSYWGRALVEPIQFVDFDCIFAPDLSRWRAIVMAKSLFWLSDEAWKALSPHLPRGRPGKPRVTTARSSRASCMS